MATDALSVDTMRGEPILVLRPDEQGDMVFHRIRAVVALEGGGIVVGSHEPRTVYVFDREGDLQWSLGGPGDGPGELRSISGAFVVPPDSLAVFDSWLGRITLFSGARTPARTIDLRRFMPSGAGASVYPTSDGFVFAGIASLGGPRAQSSYRDSADSYLLDSEGDSVGYYGRFPGAEVLYTDRLFGPLRFGGLLTSGVRDDHLIIGTGDEPELREYDATGPSTCKECPTLASRLASLSRCHGPVRHGPFAESGPDGIEKLLGRERLEEDERGCGCLFGMRKAFGHQDDGSEQASLA